jgi:hypothetical protein
VEHGLNTIKWRSRWDVLSRGIVRSGEQVYRRCERIEYYNELWRGKTLRKTWVPHSPWIKIECCLDCGGIVGCERNYPFVGLSRSLNKSK